MKKMKEMKFHLATGLLLLTYYLIFNVIPDLDFTVALSDEIYYVFQVLLVLILGTVSTIIFVKSEHWKECGRFQFRWSYLFYCVLAFFLLFVWNRVTFSLFPPTRNAISYQHYAPTFTGATAFLMYFFYPVIAGPIFEEMIYRGLVMTALEKGKKWGLDVLGSAALFGILHISDYGWVLTDFFVYMGGGIIFALLFRVTKSIYWPIGLHIVYNGIGQILMFLH